MKHYGDITKINGAAVEPVDVLIGGSPCQDLSIAGKQAGLNGERSGLFMEQLRIIKEMRRVDVERGHTGKSIRPRYMVWENVPGAFSSNRGKDFGIVLKETVAVACGEVPAIPKPRKGWPNAGCLTDVGGQWSVAWRVFDAQFWGVPQRRKRISLVADFGGMSAPEILFERQGVSGNTEPGGAEREGIAGNTETSVNVPDRTVCCLQRNGIEHPVVAFENYKFTKYRPGCGILRASGGGMEMLIAVLNDQGGSAISVEREDISPTLRSETHGNLPIVVINFCNSTFGEVSPALQAHGSGGYSLNSLPCIQREYTVRRLTPLECERLQGFPDNWTDIGPWRDSKGKLHKECSDSARYKAIGNSIALPSWAWVLERLSSYYGERPTMASLFDGIGGFPLVWERINGKGSCIWASEVEEFPIAVTKYHFPEESEDNQ